VFETARELGLLLIPAAEMRLEGADVVVVNLTPEEARGLRRIGDLAELRKRRGGSVFIFPPHPFYILGGSIGSRRLAEHIELFDAIELCHFYTRWFNPNRRAHQAAKIFHKPLVATSDTHRLDFFGSHYTLVQVPPLPAIPCAESIFDAIRAGTSRTVSPPWPLARFLRYTWWILVQHELRVIQARLAGHRAAKS
jgi:predicted metal-dependent phosphoesterase TrpH